MSMYFGGIPTGPDVNKLMEAFPDIEPGQEVPYVDVQRATGIKPKSNRWMSVTLAWRKRLYKEFNIVIECIAGRAFRRLTEVERSARDASGWVQDQRRAGRKVRDLVMVDTADFNAESLRAHDHRRRVLTTHMEVTRTACKEIAPPSPARALPRGASAGL